MNLHKLNKCIQNKKNTKLTFVKSKTILTFMCKIDYQKIKT